jgi:two-component system, chemotaxis family, protein-glutamate methylesterase/glutaminase
MSVRVLIVDDSSFFREVLRDVLSQFSDLEVVGEAGDGLTAQRMVHELRPDVVTMDVLMPLISGMEAVRSIMAEHPTPIIVLSRVDGEAERVTLAAIGAGAIDAFAKPEHGFTDETARQLADLLRQAAQARPPRMPGPSKRPPTGEPRPQRAPPRIVGIAASTGGPQLLRSLLEQLPATFPVPIAVVQHTIEGFTSALVDWLDESSALRVLLSQPGMRARTGEVIVAPDGYHLEISQRGVVRHHDLSPIAGHRPSATVLFRSLADNFGKHALAVVLTGMGRDGADGARAIEQAGGTVVVQSPKSAALDGMPRAALAATARPILAADHELVAVLKRLTAGVRA